MWCEKRAGPKCERKRSGQDSTAKTRSQKPGILPYRCHGRARQATRREYLEKLGHYDPIETKKEKQVLVNMDRYNHWIKLGAQATEAV